MIETPDSPELAALCKQLAERAGETDRAGAFPAEQLRLCGEAGVFRWFLAPEHGGFGWDEEAVVRGYLALSEACLTTTFVITQRTGACRRIAGGGSDALRARLLPGLASGAALATVGISHLTTSGRHLKQPMLRATRTDAGWRLDGAAPWVTGGDHADWLVVGATVMDRDEPTSEQLLAVVPGSLEGVTAQAPFELVGVSASSTGPVRFDGAQIGDDLLLAGPVENVMAQGIGGRTGGHETSTLALGLASAAIGLLNHEGQRRENLHGPTAAIVAERDELVADLLSITRGAPSCTTESLRRRANSLALRAAQASLAAAKGAGYVAGHPAGRWCRESLFFLVWSCPQPVLDANLCELAGIVG
ncbi:Glutaryl-CoA dehydrogenase [Pirellulimonas nuda]|uniref:Glutaryl-CoA dehydrogenase n=1 Tax=Pirellulimonas nuda TaxID=2528009 RepID=A0A518D6K5_9BACT|nr:acyl-CoA dehydrogenase family protein [Pirellulimonas nuda]QDU87086.1 Glutaryl-CoA dehydrogenase [Pirellulimonas nuda]